MSEASQGRDRLRELLDAVLDERHRTLEEMAGGALSSPYHFARQLSAGAGEPPVAMRRRVMLERAAWRLRRGGTVTDAAFEAGYESVEGFSRAFTRAYGHRPSEVSSEVSSEAPNEMLGGGGHWLPAPNGIHFHPPTSLWVHAQEHMMSRPLDLMVRHDLDDTRDLIELAKQLPEESLRRELRPGQQVLDWDGPEPSVSAVLGRIVLSKEVWVAAIVGEDLPTDRADTAADLLRRHAAVAPRWLETIRDIDRRDAWDDRVVDALCEPPESFVLASVAAHVLTYSAHRRLAVRPMLAELGAPVDDGDPITWTRRRSGGDE